MHQANHLSNHPINVDNFEKFTKALKSFGQYKSERSNDKLDLAIQNCFDFYDAEPSDIRSFGLLYNLGIAALANKKNYAEKLFRYAISLEPYIAQRIFELQIPLKKTQWKRLRQQEFTGTYYEKKVNLLDWALYFFKSRFRDVINKLPFSIESKSEHNILISWSEGISYALNALGQTLEDNCREGLFGNCSNTAVCNKEKCYVNLSESKEAYERASKLASDDALSLSNLASLKIEKLSSSIEKKANGDLILCFNDRLWKSIYKRLVARTTEPNNSSDLTPRSRNSA